MIDAAKDKGIFRGLDTLRGIAAVTVALYHFLIVGPQAYIIGSGHLAVDFFFCLSGFVIAYAYEDRLRSGLSAARFIVMRYIRFYPFYLLGFLAAVVQWSLFAAKHSDPTLSRLPVSSVLATFWLNLFFLPGPTIAQATAHVNFPTNPPAWSLCLELVINIVYALIVRFLHFRVLCTVIGMFAIALIATVSAHQSSDFGFMHDELFGGFLRCGFSFFTGVLVYRLRKFQRLFKPSRLWLIAILLVALVYIAPLQYRAAYDLAAIIVLFPAIVWFGSSPQSRETASHPIFHMLGDTSYGLYAIHYPIMCILFLGWTKLTDPAFHRVSDLVGVVFVAIIVVLTSVLDRYYDRPLRKYLLRKSAPTPISGNERTAPGL